MRNEKDVPQEDIDKFGKGRFNGALLFDYQDPALAETLGINPLNCIVRLPDSVYTKPDGSKYIPAYYQYALDCAVIIKRFYEKGYRRFQLSNEDNLTWPAIGQSPAICAWFYSWAIQRMGYHFALWNLTGVLLGAPPLSMPTESVEWFDAMAPVREKCQWVAAHCYWQGSRIDWEDFGASYRWIQDRMQEKEEYWKPVYVTECGTSDSTRNNPPDQGALEATMCSDYPRYISQCAADGVSGIYFFILGSNEDWKGFEMSSTVCEAIGARSVPHTAGGGSRISAE